MMFLADRIDMMVFLFAGIAVVVPARSRGTGVPVMLTGSETSSLATMGSGVEGSRRDNLRAKLMKLDCRDWVFRVGVEVGVADTAAGVFGVMEKAANNLSITLPNLSAPAGNDLRDRLLCFFSLRSLSARLLSSSSLFFSFFSPFILFFILLLLLLSFFSLVEMSVDVLGDRRSGGTKPGG